MQKKVFAYECRAVQIEQKAFFPSYIVEISSPARWSGVKTSKDPVKRFWEAKKK